MTTPTATGHRSSLRTPWAATVLVAAALALTLVLAGVVLSRHEAQISQKPAGNRVEDAFRESNRRVAEMERLWEEALDAEAVRLLDKGLSLPPDGRVISGVAQRSLLSQGSYDLSRSHLLSSPAPQSWYPVLEKYQRKDNKDEWVLPEASVLNGSGWIEMPGKPLAWWHGNGRSAALLLLDPIEAGQVVADDLKSRAPAAGLAEEPGQLSFEGPDGKPWAESGKLAEGAKPDEILRHVSRFGDWTLLRYYPVRVEVSHRLPVLAGAFSLALLVLFGGVWIAVQQRKSIRIAEERVSFVNRVSHELRTPLTNLLLNADLALDQLPVEDGKLRRRLGLIREETSRLSRIVDNVLAFARIEHGKHENRVARCDVGEVVGELREGFAPLFERKSIVCDYQVNLVSSVPVDRDALAQILSNLLSNVEKYAGEGSKAVVGVSADDKLLTVEVLDNGPGIPREARQRVFLPFERAGSRVDEGASGTGLGLAISRELAQRMGGRLDLVQTEHGAKFRLEVPLQESVAP
ncbi:HAMP domain-containing sensor histidine kinase [Haloferula sp. BvORR071]|uniref:sensor histidine kinase n=1 Tax=Haloferula sp. BvORR071 TaxID=1396141 RepID=UPI000695FDDB|nr:HAMP domain-containing sensor histidine kinase [Haloferula sp. BvORR071]